MQKTCPQCSRQFTLTDDSAAFLAERKLPLPTRCPDCRQQRRLCFRNERSLYMRRCDLCRKEIVSIYAPDKLLTVYCSDCWYGDKWDPLSYGRNFDFSRSFFDQFKDLMKEVPALANMVFKSVNCEYNSFCVNSKDCYMSARVGDSEKIMYSYLPLHSLSCGDCSIITDCQYCYECFDCRNCYNLLFSRHCKTTSDSAFCADCIGCRNCIGCVELRNAEYHVFNEKVGKEGFEKFKAENDLSDTACVKKLKARFEDHLLKFAHRATIIQNCENCTGDYIVDSKNINNCFDVEKSDTAYDSFGVEYCRDIHDGSFVYYAENCHENIANASSTGISYSAITMSGSYDLQYCFSCVNGANNSFGCVSLKKHDHCILNRHYSKDEYVKMSARIIEHMKKTGEYGQFFPQDLSPFAYNESVACAYYPLEKEQVKAKGWQWREPDGCGNTAAVKDAKKCSRCGRTFRLIAQEKDLYKKLHVAAPENCPDCRYKTRTAFHNPRVLVDRKCAKCGAQIKTTYAPDRPEKVYCESCYLKEVY